MMKYHIYNTYGSISQGSWYGPLYIRNLYGKIINTPSMSYAYMRIYHCSCFESTEHGVTVKCSSGVLGVLPQQSIPYQVVQVSKTKIQRSFLEVCIRQDLQSRSRLARLKTHVNTSSAAPFGHNFKQSHTTTTRDFT